MFGTGSSIGLYIDGKRIYLAELRSQFGESQIVRTVESDIQLTPTNPTPDADLISRSISDIFAKENISTREVFIALTEKESIVRYFEMPLLPQKERREAVRFEAQKYLPFEIRDLYYDSAIQPDTPQKKMRITFLAAKKEAVHKTISIVQKAGLRVRSLESASMATTRALYPADAKPTDEAFAILDIDKKGFIHILIVKNDMLLMARDHLYFRSADAVGLSAPDFKSCVSEVRLSLGYFTKTFKNEALSKIIICADLKDTFKDWDSQLEAELGIPVRAGNPVGSFTANQTYSAGMTTAIGLGMRGTSSRHAVKLNLVPRDKPTVSKGATSLVSQQAEDELLKKMAIFELIAFVLIGAAVYYFLIGKLAMANADLAKRSSTIPAEYALPLQQLKAKEDAQARKIRVMSSLIDNRFFFTTKLNQMAKLIPDYISLTTLDYTDVVSGDGESSLQMNIQGTVYTKVSGVDLPEVNKLAAAFSADKEFMAGFVNVSVLSANNAVVKEGVMTRFIIYCQKTAPSS